MQFHKKVLDNGLRAIAVPMPSVESASVMVMVGAGSRYETFDNNGVSHFLEHMAFKGTEKRPSSRIIATIIDGIGGEWNAFTSKEVTAYYIKSKTDHVDICMDVLSDILMHSKFDQEEIDKERGVIIEEINMYEDMPIRKIGDIYENLLYGDTPMGWDIAGRKEIIKTINRKDFIDYMECLYSASNITVVVAGGVEAEQAFEMIDKYFGKMKQFDTQGYKKVIDFQKGPQMLIKQKKTEQVHVALGVRTVMINNPDRYPLAVLSAILGGGMSSRLFHEVREKRGLAYYVRTVSEHYHDAGTLISFAGMDPSRIEDAVKVIINEYVKLKDKKVESRDELSKAKEFLKGHMVLELEDSKSVAAFYAQQELLEQNLENIGEVLEKIDKVTTADLERVADNYFIENGLNLALIGDIKNEEKLQSLLKI